MIGGGANWQVAVEKSGSFDKVKRFVKGCEAMPDLTPGEIAQAKRIAYWKSLARGNGQDPPSYDPEAAVGDFWQAAGEIIAQRDRLPQSADTRRTSVQRVIPDSMLGDGDVLAEVRRLRKANGNHMRTRNQSMTSVLRKDQRVSHQMLLRGVGFGSSSHDAALNRVAVTHPKHVEDDYPDLDLPPASFWCDPNLKTGEAFWAFDHAFGGDYPQRWDDAQKGVILAHPFMCQRCRSRPTDAQLQQATAAWIFLDKDGDKSKDRGESLVFTTIEGCHLFSPWGFVRAAVSNDGEADILLCAIYLNYLKDKCGFGNERQRGRAEELLKEYCPVLIKCR